MFPVGPRSSAPGYPERCRARLLAARMRECVVGGREGYRHPQRIRLPAAYRETDSVAEILVEARRRVGRVSTSSVETNQGSAHVELQVPAAPGGALGFGPWALSDLRFRWIAPRTMSRCVRRALAPGYEQRAVSREPQTRTVSPAHIAQGRRLTARGHRTPSASRCYSRRVESQTKIADSPSPIAHSRIAPK